MSNIPARFRGGFRERPPLSRYSRFGGASRRSDVDTVVEGRAMRGRTGSSFALVRTVLRGATALAQGWRRLIGESYRPEKHYMRGPGPKWRAKYGRQPQDASRGG